MGDGKDMGAPRILQWSMDSGYLTMSFPAEMTPVEVDEIEAVLAITVGMMRRAALATEARSCSVEDESPVLEEDAPDTLHPSSIEGEG